ncbi:cytochrome P450 [Parathielavia hyrcaniae]|uniref:Cytochrome P450 n=1 Tax=Parathielavia hyrcaniae TaxID=113614 RepID=A0AAN6PW06_9PEZI|nr:cytochrome P450 [Parathielavia hyrcaniae]
MLMLIAELLILGASLLVLVYFVFLHPPKYPVNIPAIPFWVVLIPFFKDVDQSDIFRRYIEQPLRTHGAVKLFFGAQWNILVHKPLYLAEMFKDEDVYQKSGNQKKIPQSLFAQFLGDNIISSHGEVWKNYRAVVKPGLQRNFETDAIARNASQLCDLLRDAQTRAGRAGVAMQEMLQRYSIANCSEVVLQTKLGALTSATAPINILQSAVKREIFKPVFMNFPVLDRFPLPSRTRVRQMVDRFKNELKRALIENNEPLSWSSDMPLDGLGRRMLNAKKSGQWTEQQLLDNLTVTFVAGQENPQLCMISTLYLLAKHPDAQTRLYTEIQSKAPDYTHPNPEMFQDMPILTAVIYESLRLFPPIGQLVNRKASEDALLGGDIVIPKGTYLGYNCYSTNRDPAVWGPRAHAFDPGRWGDSPAAIQKQYRLRKSRAEFISFHGGRRACLGEKFALLEMRITLVYLICEFTWTLDPRWLDRMTPVIGDMDFSNEGQSFYHRARGGILHSVQHNSTAVTAHNQSSHAGQTAFDDFFARLILDQADLCVGTEGLHAPETESTTQKLVDLFDSYLRYEGKDDKWTDTGRTYFTERIRHFTTRNLTIQFGLPAFPCKSSNLDKVTGRDPDRGEELALERLHGFVEAIERIYEPGAMLWIISDGHVFSDCIGVDDADVDAYGHKLKEMNICIGQRRGNLGRVGFKSLVDLFQLGALGPDGTPSILARQLNIPDIDHHVKTKVTDEAELCRRILIAGCGPQQAAIRAKIDSKDAAITALYRGFSRFMLEDLENRPNTKAMTRSQQKKVSSKVAFEMILMLFPNHVRLSIHAHNNAGPKFGIQLFDPAHTRAVAALSPDGELMTSVDLLHIPTPWHNCVVELAGSSDDVVLVTKAKLARAALSAGSVTGGLVGTGEGGSAYFSLQRKDAGSVGDGTAAAAHGDPAGAVAMATVAVKDKGVAVVPVEALGQVQRRTTLSEKADAVVAAVVRRNTGGGYATREPFRPARRDSWVGRLRWILSLFWPKGS